VSANIPDRLTGDQRQLLEWIADGCPAGRYQDYAHRISARALSEKLARVAALHAQAPPEPGHVG
jgi:hypothetical protein